MPIKDRHFGIQLDPQVPSPLTITITNDKGHLFKEEINRMVEEAEKYKGKIYDCYIYILHDTCSFYQLRMRLQLLVSTYSYILPHQ